MIAVIDAGSGNIGSVKKALDYLKIKSTVVSRADQLKDASAMILPGVGNFGQVMHNLRERGLVDVLIELINKGILYLGICVGLQILFESTEEVWSDSSQTIQGLGLLKGKVVKFQGQKVPQIGWNALEDVKVEWLKENTYVYYVNSFYAVPVDEEIIAARSSYGVNFTAVVVRQNIKAVQFHPEKSGPVGLEIMRKVLGC